MVVTSEALICCVPKSDTPTHIDNFVNSRRIFKILLLADFLENVR